MSRISATVVCALLVGAAAARAQAPEGSATLTQSAVAESLVVLKSLDSVIAAHPNDAAAWYHRGMIGWALYERDRNKPPIPGLDWTRLGHMADTSLRLAAELDPANGTYRMMAGRYILSSGVSITRAGSYSLFDKAVEAARKSGDPRMLAETAVEAGRVYWRRYDNFAHRWMMKGGNPACEGAISYNSTLDVPGKQTDPYASKRQGARMTRDELQQIGTELPPGEVGEADYIRSETLFREAFEADPTFERAFRQFAMLLAERTRWSELATAARVRARAVPNDAWAWLTLGLALHREKREPKFVGAAFDTAMTLLPADERKRLDRLERILNPNDSARFAATNGPIRGAYQNLFWKSADQLWSLQGNEPRSEFLARITYAELRWTVEEMKVRGADSDRGDIHIRYGPADLIAVIPPAGGDSAALNVCTIWSYNVGMTFYFIGALTFATARIPPADQAQVHDMEVGNPARWDNVNAGLRIDPLPVQAARFRAAGDSVDVFVATLPPSDSIRKAADVKTSARADFWLLNGELATIVHDSTMQSVTAVRSYTHRVPAGAYFFRTEATADGSRYAARTSAPMAATTDTLTGFRLRGFGMSDLLISTSATSRGTAKRWSDFEVSPLVGPAAAKAELSLLWENYELADQSGSARYTVTLQLEKDRSTAGRIAVQVLGALARSVAVQRSDDRVTMQFERSVAYASTLVDNVQLSLRDTPAGTYRLTLAVADHGSGRTTSRSVPLVIRP